MSNTLKDIRAGAARKCKDWVRVIATSNSADTSVFIDAMNLYENDHHFRGSDVWFKNDTGTAANRGLTVRCTDSDLGNTSISLGSGLVAAPATGDEAWLFNIGGMGTRIHVYDATINDAIRSLGHAAATVYSDELTDAWDVDDPWVDIPAEFTHISGVQYEGADGIFYDVQTSAIAVDLVQRKFTISKPYSTEADGYNIVLLGKQAHPELTDDDDTTDVDYEWLTSQVAASILLQKREQVLKVLGGQMQNYADMIRGKAAPMGLLESAIRVR